MNRILYLLGVQFGSTSDEIKSFQSTGAVAPSSPGTPFVSTQDVKGLGLIPLACFRKFTHRCSLSEIPALDDKSFLLSAII